MRAMPATSPPVTGSEPVRDVVVAAGRFVTETPATCGATGAGAGALILGAGAGVLAVGPGVGTGLLGAGRSITVGPTSGVMGGTGAVGVSGPPAGGAVGASPPPPVEGGVGVWPPPAGGGVTVPPPPVEGGTGISGAGGLG